jgi:thiol-disulfide isomerase/thioredoxin
MNDAGSDGDSAGQLTRRRLLTATGAAGIGVVAGCSGAGGGSTGDSAGGTGSTDAAGSESTDTDAQPASTWRTTELTSVRDDETFTVAGFDQPVVIQSFAVWCPKCEQQSAALSGVDDSVTVVGLNTDPNEDAAKVRQHAEDNGFDWRFAVAPAEMTESLIDQFGATVTNAPSTPVIVACQDGDATFMSGSINPAEEILDAATEC